MDTKKIRQDLKLSKYAFANKLGISWNTVFFWEKGLWKPNKENQKKIESLLKEENDVK